MYYLNNYLFKTKIFYKTFLLATIIMVAACGGSSSDNVESEEGLESSDQDPLILTEVISIPKEIGNVKHVDYVFHSNISGMLHVDGSCEANEQQVIVGNNTVPLNNLTTGVYDDCKIIVTTNDSLKASILINQFKVDNTPPNVNITNSIGKLQTNIRPVEIVFEADEAGELIFTGRCRGSRIIEKGINSVLLNDLDLGSYHDCQVTATDDIGNQSSPLDIPQFFVHVTEIPYITYTGEQDSIIDIEYTDAIFNSSTDAECEWLSTETCMFQISHNIFETPVLDLNKSLLDDSFYSLQIGDNISLTTDTSETDEYFENLRGHEVISFQGKLWVIGGNNISRSGPNNDIWSSKDGLHWHKEDANLVFTERFEHEVVEFNGKLWVIGGSYYEERLNDIWSSVNGIDWVLESSDGVFSPRKGHEVILFQNKLWLIGGNSGSEFFNDIWSSENGVDWNIEVEESAFSKRANHKIVMFEQKLWLIGGGVSGVDPYKNDIWSSNDGVTWIEELEEAPFSGGKSLKLINFGNRLWIIGGTSFSKDIWSSTDGIAWVKELDSAPFPQRSEHEVVVFLGKIWLIGGDSWIPNESYKNDVWSSVDGINWTRETTEPDLPRVSRHQSVVHEDRIYVTQDSYVWSSEDGLSWRIETKDLGLGSREASQLVTFSGKLWLYGGIGNIFNSIWSSKDGSTWETISDSESLFSRAGHQMLVHDDKLWLLGGGDDVWFSTDGISWDEVNYGQRFTARFEHQAAFFEGKFWLIGGGNSGAEIWSSTDGADWVLENENADFGFRRDHQVTEFEGKLWLIGGTRNLGSEDVKNDIWSSIDGVNWLLENEKAAFSPRYAHQMEVFDGKLWLIGGINSVNESLNDVWISENGVHWRKISRGKFQFYKD